MVNSIKYWLGAYQVIDFSTDIAVQTDFGELIDKYDPYLENPATLWLLHWKLSPILIMLLFTIGFLII